MGVLQQRRADLEAPVASTTTGMVNGELSGLYQLTQAETGDLVRAVATFTDDTGQVQITTSTRQRRSPRSRQFSAWFSYAVDDFSISKTLSGSTTNFNDNFSNGAPPIGGLFGTSVNAFATNGGGGGTTWTKSSGHAIMSSSGAAFNGINNSVEATLPTNTSPEGTGSGQSNQGLKEDATFTVGGTFQLVAPAAGTGYGITLFNAATGVPTTEEVQLLVDSTGSGGANVALVQADPATDTFTSIANLVLTAQELSGNTQIVLTLAHNTVNTSTITGSFVLLDNGTQTFTDTFTPTGHVFNSQTYTRAEIMTFSNDGVIVTGTAQQGQTLTAETATNDVNAKISYQWEELSSSSFTSFTDMGTNSATYQVQSGDVGDFIRVVATATESATAQAATATSTATAQVAALAGQTDEWLNTAGGTWTDIANAATNWSDGALPRSIDAALIDKAGTYTVTIPTGATANAASITLNDANATLLVQGAVDDGGAFISRAGKGRRREQRDQLRSAKQCRHHRIRGEQHVGRTVRQFDRQYRRHHSGRCERHIGPR